MKPIQQNILAAPGAAKYYGEPGDRCGCGQLLSQYNPRDRCSLCGGGKKRPRRRGAPASACSEAAPQAAPAPRHSLGEEIEMAAQARHDRKQRQEDALAYLQDGNWHTGSTVAKAIGVPRGSIFGILGRLVENGLLESRNHANGGGYRLRQDAAAKAAQAAYEDEKSAKDAPAGPAGAAPVTTELDPEQPANEAPAPTPETLQAPVPFAGGEYVDPEDNDPRPVHYLRDAIDAAMTRAMQPPDREMRVLNDLDAMTDEQRDRTLQFAVAKWWPFPKPEPKEAT